jgi:hypothetical protein
MAIVYIFVVEYTIAHNLDTNRAPTAVIAAMFVHTCRNMTVERDVDKLSMSDRCQSATDCGSVIYVTHHSIINQFLNEIRHVASCVCRFLAVAGASEQECR